jgi:hypothetical protein
MNRFRNRKQKMEMPLKRRWKMQMTGLLAVDRKWSPSRNCSLPIAVGTESPLMPGAW